ncbi:beta-ketoacyl-[acyl-carrier-protein] synthase family protein [Variovorax dokdonensis]|uniref:Nodulation protein E n=1 Tax=Variovorax dokdonensis TaxID=344883 RepID=A0ABT7N5E7_9BURK|nr:beta-ketoacyl-[acyl-carrier-protein] synthase family protein [Variovorax dokdonensis]MDM0043146.1 beta-ketoacyl-[acyl-carrier-protein] synthase family protein [Variovorax dokdonensis]
MTTGVGVTGMGLVSPHGTEPLDVFDALVRGQSALRAVFPELARPAVAATVDFDPSPWFNKLQLAGVDRVSQMAVAAATKALEDGGSPLADAGLARDRVGVYVGCGMGGATALETAYGMGASSGRVPPLTIPAFMPNAPAAHIAMRHGITGPVLSYAVACASSAVAIAEAAKAVACGDVDVAIAGGTEALIVPGVVQAWQAMQTLASAPPEEAAGAVRPFGAERSGFALGEGAAFLVLEAEHHAQARGARIHARLAGWGMSCDATHLTKPNAQGQARALNSALRMADMSPRDVGYCNAHGTATRVGDPVECEALAAVWGDDLQDLKVSSTKALHGHLLGAAGALEALISIMALRERRLPPNFHGAAQDPACAVALVTREQTEAANLQAAISSSFAFGGTNAALLFASI